MDNIWKTIIVTTLVLIVLVVVLVARINRIDIQSKNAPINPIVNEAIGQARALQKLGKLSEAFVIFERYAEEGYPDAMFYTAKAYSRGWGVQPDLKKARKISLEAVQYGFSYRGETAYGLGRLFQRSHGPDCNSVAVEWFKKALQWNYKKASLQLAVHYERGLGVEQNTKQARAYYEIAVRAGNEQAMIKYARLLVDGRYGVTPDLSRAQALSEQAISSLGSKARGGSGSAAKQLGRIYRDGKLVPADLEQAYKWLLRSARLGSTGGMHDLARLMLSKPGHDSEHDEALAWLRIAARQGHGGAMTALGRYHLREKYKLLKIGSVRWFEMGVAAKHGGAMEELARLYELGLLVERNHSEAVRLAKKGTKFGHSGSRKLLRKLLNVPSNIKNPLERGKGENYGL
ncbi:MAG: tetratricopeptide repeat protein [Rhizobiaceae bacterium]